MHCSKLGSTNTHPPLGFSPTFTDTHGTKEGRVKESPFFDTDSTSLAQLDTWYPELIHLSMKNPLLLPQHPNLF